MYLTCIASKKNRQKIDLWKDIIPVIHSKKAFKMLTRDINAISKSDYELIHWTSRYQKRFSGSWSIKVTSRSNMFCPLIYFFFLLSSVISKYSASKCCLNVSKSYIFLIAKLSYITCETIVSPIVCIFPSSVTLPLSFQLPYLELICLIANTILVYVYAAIL